MRVVIQRVTEASVKIEDKIAGSISNGMLVLVGFEETDTHDDIDWMVGKIVRLRIFGDENGVMNLDVTQVNGNILAVSQFTLHASTKKGNRPSYIKAANPSIAIPLYNKFIEELQVATRKKIETGIFGAMMMVSLVNDGPVTIIIDSKIRE
jgi:D-tyrosyl-tRNA(Tyr) deacylase